MPAWYEVLRAAKYLNVKPWELAEQPIRWLNMATTAEGAEAKATARWYRKQGRKKRKGRRG